MNEFNLWRYSELLAWLTQDEALMHQMADENGGQDVLPVQKEQAVTLLKEVADFCMELGYQSCYDVASTTAITLGVASKVNISFLYAQMAHAKNALMREGFYRKFLRVNGTLADYLNQLALFGQLVSDAFPSAARDVMESGNCLATEAGTASVFHLMRASEFALRSLARDRDVEFKDKPLDEKEWGQILGALEGKVKMLRDADRKCWTSSEVRDAEIRFYSEVVQELRGFNDAWRPRLSRRRACLLRTG